MAFLRRHNFLPDRDYYDEFIRINRGKFGKNDALLLDISYDLPSRKNNTKSQATTAKPERKIETISEAEMAALVKIRKARGEDNNAVDQPETKTVQPEPAPAHRGTVPLGKESLFGKEYEEYPIEDQALAGAHFFLASGHGGPDPGATYYLNGKTLHEDEYAYDIMLRLARNLLMHGAVVDIIIQDTRDGIRNSEYLNTGDTETCMGEKIPTNQEQRLKQRCTKINNLSASAREKYQRAIFIHLDSRSNSQQTDVYFYHTNNSKSEQLAQTARNTFQTQYDKHQTDRGFNGTISFRDLYVLRNTTPVAIYAEVGNIRNSFDQKRFLLSDNRQAIANWLALALIEDYANAK
ncbi:MAG: N-acetylmuramoyl-L-alanine amidase [Dysgonamonadaceae bacterium]|nr:N-acetylmuramoyl-L-alanine amidase [Dysgonamonadaceae bacterium]